MGKIIQTEYIRPNKKGKNSIKEKMKTKVDVGIYTYLKVHISKYAKMTKLCSYKWMYKNKIIPFEESPQKTFDFRLGKYN